MTPLLFIQFPDWISPEILPGLPFRWYGLMYLFAFATAYYLVRLQQRMEDPKDSVEVVGDLFFWAILGLLLGARLVSVLVYDTTGQYWAKPWLIFWPFDQEMHFTGLQGMSYHGGLIGAFAGLFLFCRRRELSLLLWADRITAAVPLGYTFGRLGNFINGELYGRVTTSAWGMIFPHAERFPRSFPWVDKLSTRLHIAGTGAVNLPRHPSQLYESLGEGVLLWLFLWFVIRPRKAFNGFILAWYLIGYGTIRFFIEYFRQPDANLGFILRFGPDLSIYEPGSWLNFSMGQLFCLIMILTGIIVYFLTRRKSLL